MKQLPFLIISSSPSLKKYCTKFQATRSSQITLFFMGYGIFTLVTLAVVVGDSAPTATSASTLCSLNMQHEILF